mgnify:CR=1 FL=1
MAVGPFLMVEVLDRPATEFGAYFALVTLVFMSGNFFGGRLGTAKSNYRVLIIETQNTYVGLLVSKVFGLKHFDTSSFSYPTDEGSENIIDQPFTKFVDATCTEITGVWYKLSPARLVVDKNFINAARTNAESGGGHVAAA